jgi:hypothetical protein
VSDRRALNDAYMAKHASSHDLSDLTRLDNRLGLQHGGIVSSLQTDHRPDATFSSELNQLFGFFQVPRQGPFAKDVLSGEKGGSDEVVVLGDVDGYGHDVDLRISRDSRGVIVCGDVLEIVRLSGGLGGGLGSVLESGDLVIRCRLEVTQVGDGCP